MQPASVALVRAPRKLVKDGWLAPGLTIPPSVSTSLVRRGALRLIVGCALLQNVDEVAAGTRHVRTVSSHDVLRLHGAAIYVRVGVIVWANRRAFQGNSGEQTARSRVAENLGSHPGVRSRGSAASLGTGRDGSVCSQFDLTAENRFHAAIIHD